MLYAIDRYQAGCEKEVCADEFYGKYIPLKLSRFYCPECGETVYWRQRGKSPHEHFYHKNKTETTPECDKRVDGHSDLYLYERVGLPLYLTRNGSVFVLNMGFPSIGEKALDFAEQTNTYLTISDSRHSRVAYVNHINFFSDSITMLPVNFVPLNGKNYSIKIESSPSKELQKKWSNYADGFSPSGGIFSYSETGGKKIRRGDSISPCYQYYLVTPERFSTFHSSVKIENVGNVTLNNAAYYVYTMEIKVSLSNEQEYNNVSRYLNHYFGVWLLSTPPEIIPLWPPVVSQDVFIPVSDSSNLYCSVSSGNDLPNVYSYNKNIASRVPINEDIHGSRTVTISKYTASLLLSVDRKYVGREISIVRKSIEHPVFSHTFSMETKNGIPLSFDGLTAKDLSNVLLLKSNAKFELYVGSRDKTYQHLSIRTKGNEPFFNIVSEQFYIQPPVPAYKDLANEGRKVLLFSDSRQRAAVLARDLSKAADEEAMKKALTVAANELQEWAENNNEIPRLEYLYAAFIKVAYQHNLRFFSGNNEDELLDALKTMGELLAKPKRKVNFKKYSESKFEYRPAQYSEHLLRQLCSSFRSLTDIGLCWLEPALDEEDIEDLMDDLERYGIPMSYEEFIKLFSAWAMEISTSVYAIGPKISDSIRREITPYYQRLGIENETELPPRIKKILESHDFTKEQIKRLTDILAGFLTQGGGEENKTSTKYLSLNNVQLKFGADHEWYKCPRCSGIFPFTLWGSCAHCGKGYPELMTESDFSGVNFWREPVKRALRGDSRALMTRINTEEHTAQLSHKDQRQKTWSTTEDFEMRFQNVMVDNDRPVDILSCTTTMEVGIDIGSLTAVGLRNIPPMRENYQQRAGRAGRRSAAISTIVTYTDNRPHDNYYYHNPEKIISGEPRTPWIDVDNITLAYRHFNVICFTDFFNHIEKGPDKVGICQFFKNDFEDFKIYLSSVKQDNFDMTTLLPQNIVLDFRKYINDFLAKLIELKNHIEAFPEEYKDDNGNEISTLDALLESGIFPTYSFPKDVVGFYVEDKTGSMIEQKPERSLETAINEYAPGRLVVINKNTYKSGGIYSHHSKFKNGYYEHPARAFFESQEYLKILYYCEDSACGWMGLEREVKCPFCGKNTIKTQNLLKPWGFAPIAGAPSNEADAEAEMTYAEVPCYSVTPREDEMKLSESFENLRYAKRANDPLIILNKGKQSKGFIVCKDCGASAPGNDAKELKWMPYRHPRSQFKCKHPHNSIINTFLGSQFRTDLVVYEIALNSDIIDTSGLWIRRAAQTLADAMTIAGGRLLDVEFNEIKSGYRLRYSPESNRTFVDVFLFDSLSSGAGYCAEIAERTDELLQSTRVVLESCSADCDCACHECLMHYWNQSVHHLLDRFAALDLLNWCKDSSLPSAITYERQKALLSPLNELGNDYKVIEKDSKHFVVAEGKQMEIIAYPAMWNSEIEKIPQGVIPISDLILKYALPKADSTIHALL